MSEKEILADFPDLEHDDFLAVFAFAADRERRLLVNSANRSRGRDGAAAFDENLSSTLVHDLADIFPASAHVRDLQLQYVLRNASDAINAFAADPLSALMILVRQS